MVTLVLVAPLARADYEISVNGTDCAGPTASGPNVIATCSSVSPFAGLTITNLSVQGIQLTGVSEQVGTTLSIVNTTSTAQTVTIYLAVSKFSTPVTPPSIKDASGATINSTTGSNSFTLTSCVDQSDGLVPPSGTFCTTPAPGEAGANPILSTTGAQTKSNEMDGTITSLHADFSLTQMLTITVGADSVFNVTSSQVLTPVPEPISITFLGTVVLGVSRLLRKKLA